MASSVGPPVSRPANTLAAILSVVIGLFMGVALLSQIGLFVIPLAPIGVYLGVRGRASARGPLYAAAWAGIVLNAIVIAVFVYVALRYLVE
ncbi:MAG TPA: hypothetical protein VJ927_10710 [Actinomycetota bacterium]|nr:hypothetical protein [Actinomycetota bacterium]